MANLDPCPFCGGKAFWHTIGDRTFGQCEDCGMFLGVDGKDNIQGLMAKWNRRVSNDYNID